MNNFPQTRKGRLMKMLTRAALALSGGAAALVLAGLVVLAVVVVVVLLFAAISQSPTSARVTPAPPATAAVAGPLDAAAPDGTGSPSPQIGQPPHPSDLAPSKHHLAKERWEDEAAKRSN
jgi:hypothetical protein